MTLRKIVSGGQTGVDRAALDAAIRLGIEYGGWCPKGRLDEKGMIPSGYSCLTEIEGDFTCDQDNFNARTVKNIIDSDGTLIIVPSWPLPENIKDGTILTIEEIKRQDKPYYILNIEELDISDCNNWIVESEIETLNIAGPRESTTPGIYDISLTVIETSLMEVLSKLSCRK